MAKKIWWSKSLTLLWGRFHNYLNITQGNVKQAVKLLHYDTEMSVSNDEERIWSMRNLRLLVCDLDHRMLHFYFNEQLLCDYLKEMELKRFDDIRKVVKRYGVTCQGYLFRKDGYFIQTKIPEIGFSIDVPYKKYGYAFLVHTTNDDKIEISCSYDYDKFITVHEYHYLSYLKKKDSSPEIEKVMQIFRLAINTIFYVEHYPQLVIKGSPRQLEKTGDEKTSFQVETCEIFQEVERRKKQGYVVQPHLRCGYWKVLRSDFYTKEKRGTTIHVGPTMVKGNASTVLTHQRIKDGKGLVEEKSSNYIKKI